MTDQTERAEIYRLRTSQKFSYSATGGRTDYFEDADALRRALLAAHLDILAQDEKGDWHKSRLAEAWRAIPPLDAMLPAATRVISVERHTDAGWVPVEYELIAPEVRLGVGRGIDG